MNSYPKNKFCRGFIKIEHERAVHVMDNDNDEWFTKGKRYTKNCSEDDNTELMQIENKKNEFTKTNIKNPINSRKRKRSSKTKKNKISNSFSVLVVDSTDNESDDESTPRERDLPSLPIITQKKPTEIIHPKALSLTKKKFFRKNIDKNSHDDGDEDGDGDGDEDGDEDEHLLECKPGDSWGDFV